MYDYFYPETAHNFAFYKVPKTLFMEPIFDSVTTDAKLLYGIMRDRVELSQQNDWIDEAGRVYIIFRIDEIMGVSRWSKGKVIKVLKELDSLKVIERVKMFNGLPDRIYIKNIHPFMDKNASKSSHNRGGSKWYKKCTTGGTNIEPQAVQILNHRRYNSCTSGGAKNVPLGGTNFEPHIRNRETENQTNTNETEREIKALTQNLSVNEKNLFFDFLKTRSNLTQEQVRLLLIQLLSVGKTEAERVTILEKTIRKGWKDFYPLDAGAPRALPQPIEKQNFEGVTYSSEFLSSLEVDYDDFIASLEGGNTK